MTMTSLQRATLRFHAKRSIFDEQRGEAPDGPPNARGQTRRPRRDGAPASARPSADISGVEEGALPEPFGRLA
ncbi:hypothetical protein M885DRAFT_507056 [Pelagophyceae sp. CCMP2097]|nr:hypothetical protein M885DRAFT_507056 [Pelagophyceae sp. CCMP2097]